jgi:hypothetical protein
MFDLSKDTILVRIRIRQPSGKRKDEQSSTETADRNGADADYVSTYISTLPKEDRMTYQTIGTEARNWFDEQTVVWDNTGWRLVSVKEYERIRQELEQRKAKFLEAAHALILRLPQIRRQLMQRGEKGCLGGLIDHVRLPERAEMQRAFAFQIETAAIANPKDLRLSHISAAAAKKIGEEIRQEQAAKVQDALRQVIERIRETVSAIARQACGEIEVADERTGEKSYRPANFKDSLIENARSLVAVIPGINITNDPFIAKIAKEMEEKLCPIEATDVRKEPAKRPEVAKKALSILERLKSGAVTAKV